MKKIISFILSAGILFSLAPLGACTDNGGPTNEEYAYQTVEKNDYMSSIYLTDYITKPSGEEVEVFAAEGKNREGSCDKGIAVSAYYTTKADGESAYTYMIPSAETRPHSVVFLDISEDKFSGGKTVEVEVTASFAVEKAIVLPEKLGVTPVVEGNTIIFSVSAYGTYTMIVNDEKNPDKAFSVFVRRPEEVAVPYGYTLIEYKPGLHFVDTIQLKSKTVLYLHAGALLVAKAPEQSGTSEAFISASHAQDVKILGHGVIDMSQLPWHARRGIYMDNCRDVEVNGVTMINCPLWTMTYMYCNNLTIKDCIIFGYRINSDAYAICSSSDVTVSDCFARSGDDLFEVKTYEGAGANNVLFENCVAWPDNCRGYGIIQETVSNITNVTYRNCSLLYQLNDWSEKMAAFVVTAGERGNVSGLLFEDCDLFYCEVFAIRFSVGANDETGGITDFNNTITDVAFKNCSFKYPSSSRGIIKFRNATENESGISDVRFENVSFGGKKLDSIDQLAPIYEGSSPVVEVK